MSINHKHTSRVRANEQVILCNPHVVSLNVPHRSTSRAKKISRQKLLKSNKIPKISTILTVRQNQNISTKQPAIHQNFVEPIKNETNTINMTTNNWHYQSQSQTLPSNRFSKTTEISTNGSIRRINSSDIKNQPFKRNQKNPRIYGRCLCVYLFLLPLALILFGAVIAIIPVALIKISTITATTARFTTTVTTTTGPTATTTTNTDTTATTTITTGSTTTTTTTDPTATTTILGLTATTTTTNPTATTTITTGSTTTTTTTDPTATTTILGLTATTTTTNPTATTTITTGSTTTTTTTDPTATTTILGLTATTTTTNPTATTTTTNPTATTTTTNPTATTTTITGSTTTATITTGTTTTTITTGTTATTTTTDTTATTTTTSTTTTATTTTTTSTASTTTSTTCSTLNFQQPPSLFATGLGPIGMVSADFNHDGHSDLAISNYNGNSIAVLLGIGNGSFQLPAITFNSNGVNPYWSAAQDFNYDGNVDLAICNEGSNTISVLLGLNNGSFQTPVIDFPSGGTTPSSIIVVDVNHDSKADLVVTNSGSNIITVFLGFGNGTFQIPGTSYAASVLPSSLVSGDFNSDGNIDLGVVSRSTNQLLIFIGIGNGTFQAYFTNYTTGSFPYVVRSADFNGDSKLDLVVGNFLSNTISIYMGTGIGTFVTSASATYSTGIASPIDIAIHDLNGDAIMDLAVSNQNGNISVYFGYENGTFGGIKLYSTAGLTLKAIVVADFNEDGLYDLAALNFANNNVAILLEQCI